MRFCIQSVERLMRTTVALDDDLVAKAQAISGVRKTSAFAHVSLKALIERESARRLVHMGGSGFVAAT